MGLTEGVLRLLSGLLLISLLVDCVPVPPGKPRKGPEGDRVSEPSTVAVWCHESAVEIRVMADLYGTGVLVDGADLRLGRHPLAKGAGPAAKCGAAAVSGVGEGGEYVILADLTDCGTELVFTDDWLVYKNSIFYSPAPSPNGIIRLEETEIPFKCHYGRQYSVDSNSLVPTWIPFISTQSAEDAFYFSLRLLTEDWRSERATNVYFLGEVIHLEASVVQGNHVPLRVFVDTCIATLVPDVNSDPRYAFIENGCFTDARVTGSRSCFFPRNHDNNLHIQLEAFRFFQHSRDSVFITCLLKAEPVALGGASSNRACSYADGRWTAVDGNDQACGRCEGPRGFSTGQKTPEIGVWKRGAKAEAGAGGRAATEPPAGASALEKSVTIGPLIFRKPEQVDAPEVLAAEHSGTSVDTPAVMATAGSAVDPPAVATDSGTVVDTPKVLPVEQGNASVEEASNNDSTLPLTGRSASTAHSPPVHSLEAGTDVDPLAASTETEDTLSTSVLAMEQVENLDDLKAEEAEARVGPLEVDTLVDEDELEGSVGGVWD
ncbi:zona pellucida sperm-binding protein 3-like [Anguilla rostrata]|uniref:zona pellucida sperm-binding protein 3-like n=1 Tax=Anguilla rostrata TaxID=7938 RepID=UPI0030D1B9BF